MVEEKYSNPVQVNVKIPAVMCTNDSLEDFAENPVHLKALKNRLIISIVNK